MPFCLQAVSWGQGLLVNLSGPERLQVLAEVSQEVAVPSEGWGWLEADTKGLWGGKS